MKLVLQRVRQASVEIGDQIHSKINRGMVIFLGIKKGDTFNEVTYLVDKVLQLRFFNNEQMKMNKDIQQIKGEILVVSQFTLYGSCEKGRRPSFELAETPQKAKVLYDAFITELTSKYKLIKTGVFGADMAVQLTNDGPVTFIIEKNTIH